MRPRALVVMVALAGCTSEGTIVAPVYDFPVDDLDATPTNLGELVLGVAREGSDVDLASSSFAPGEGVPVDGLPFADDLVIHLAGRVGASDVAYGRSCSFALRADAEPPEPHLLFARSVKFASIGLTAQAGIGDLGAPFPDGSALITGAGGAERFDPRTATLAPLVGTLIARTGGSATAFGLGASQQIALIGGASTIELIAPDGRVETVDDGRLDRDGATATTLTDGRIIMIGGGETLELDATQSGPELVSRPALETPRKDHSATRLGDDVGAAVLVVGGIDSSTGTPVAKAELYKPLAGAFADPQVFTPLMLAARYRHQAVLLPDGSVLVVGGLDASGLPVRSLERFTIDAGFVPAGTLPATAGVVDVSATIMPDGRILLAGGRTTDGGAPVDTAFIARLDAVDGTVDIVATDRMAVPRAGHQATLLCDGTILVTGGTDVPSVVERYNPPAAGRR